MKKIRSDAPGIDIRAKKVFTAIEGLPVVSHYTFTEDFLKLRDYLLEHKFIDYTNTIDKAATALIKADKDMGIEYLTDYSHGVAQHTFETWQHLYKELFIKYMDGNIKTRIDVPKNYKYIAPAVSQPGYGEAWYKRIVEETDDHFKVIDNK